VQFSAKLPDFGISTAYSLEESKVAYVCHKQSGGRILEMKNLFTRLWKEEEGQDLVEYGLLIVLVALAAIAAMKGLASAVSSVFSAAASNLTSASS